MKNEPVAQTGSDYSIHETKLGKPCIYISDIDKDLKENEIVEAIKNQNVFMKESDQIKLALLSNNKNKSAQFAIVECNGLAFRKLIAREVINVGMRRCTVPENLNVTRCYNYIILTTNHKIADTMDLQPAQDVLPHTIIKNANLIILRV
ncbi:hypothetical protein HHI36_001540 [Cryptolaemus montrouzieri]|uniref:Uncharacterized protein n=1 Tax=Cryptolaemus montrouzieri TaxID=559131 RepID=A0ABD2P8M8_9CUCU